LADSPRAQQLAAVNEHHIAPTAAQQQNVQAAAKDPTLSLNNNHGHPTVAATAHPEFKGPGIVAAQPGMPIAAGYQIDAEHLQSPWWCG
jgi:hypothetical protein